MIRFTPSPLIDALIDIALSEDIGCGDATADALIPIGAAATMNIVAREPLVLCGQPIVERIIARFGPRHVELKWSCDEGAPLQAGGEVAVLRGELAELLVLERTMLNFLQRLSGVATLTRRYVDEIHGTSAKLVDTRKTLPGYRALDKYATRVGGAANHRAGLDGGILIKDNHLRAAGGVHAAVSQARSDAPHSLRIEVEVETEHGFDEAVEAGADVIMLDNFTPEGVRSIAEKAPANVILEASGGIGLENIREYAEAGAQIIAVGAITHSARAVDIAAEILDD